MDYNDVSDADYHRRRNGDNWKMTAIILFSIFLGAGLIFLLLIYRHQLFVPNRVDFWCSKMWFGD
jgi:hypothetical protein